MTTVDDYDQYEAGCKNLDIKQFSSLKISKTGRIYIRKEITWLSLIKKERTQTENSQTRDLSADSVCGVVL